MTESPGFGLPPAGRYFVKMQGLRNHFVITDARDGAYQPSSDEIVRVCDPQVGVGGDQLIVLEPPRQAGADVFMRILNVDGREAEACGNATRCVAWLLMEESGTDAIVVETLAGQLACSRQGDQQVRCDMGIVSLDWRDIPLAEERDTLHLELSFGPLEDAIALGIGNPHVVYFVDDVDAIDLRALAPKVQAHPLFPNSVNVGIASLIDSDHVASRVYS